MSLQTNIKRILRYGFIGFIRNGFVSLAAVMIMSITLFVLAGLLISGAALNATLKQLTDQVDVTVYFTTSATQDQITHIQTSLKALPEVAAVTYTSPDQAISAFKERHKNDQLTIQALDEIGGNPLGASIEIRAKQTSQYESIAQYLNQMQTSGSSEGSAIDKINFYQNKTAIDRLTAIIDASRKAGIAIALVLGISSALIAFNTIRLAIYTARDEINVMNLVGAGRWYVRGPFIISGILYGVFSALLVLLLLYPITMWIGPSSERFFVSFNVFKYFTSAFGYLFLVITGSGIALGGISSYLAVRRYLN